MTKENEFDPRFLALHLTASIGTNDAKVYVISEDSKETIYKVVIKK